MPDPAMPDPALDPAPGPGSHPGYALLRAARPDDVWLAHDVNPDRIERSCVAAEAVAWVSRHPVRQLRWLTAIGAGTEVARLVVAALVATPDPVSGLTVPADAHDLLPEHVRPPTPDVWTWWWTREQPPPVRAEADVVELSDDDPDLPELLAHSDSVYVFPGDPRVRRWAGVRAGADLVACGALTEHVPGVPHIASMVTRPDQRGRGLAGAVCAWLTRRALVESKICTLGMYAANAPARRVYERIGFTLDKTFSSGYLPGHSAPADLPASDTEAADGGGTA